jgi:NAD(P)H-quinone oxidoreductase subunit 5
LSAPWVLQNAYLIVLLPFIAGTIIILGGRHNKTLSMMLSIGAVFLGFLQSVFIFAELPALNNIPYQVNWDWFVSGSFKLTMGLLVDNLAAVMLIIVTTVSLLVQIYTHGYMREDPGYSRFYSYLSLFTGSMLGLVVSTNLFESYFFWELVGVCSYFLIGFWWYKPTASAACLKAFIVNRVGDFGFLIGVLLLLGATWGFWQANPDHGILLFTDPSGIDISGAIRWGLDPAHGSLTLPLLTGLACVMFLGPMAKSAQFPLHVWLPDAMEGPTPISALIHAATMVAAGIYLVARAYPIWLNWSNPADPVAAGSTSLAVVAWIGGFTAFMAATIALTQFDIKRALAWSTVSQLGYMFVGLGVGSMTGGIFHLFTHAFFKAMLFLCSGAVIHALHGEQDMRKMGGLGSELKITRTCFLVGCLAISGVPLFSGFFSKDEIIGAAWSWQGPGHEVLAPLMIFTAGLTAFYMFRMYFMTFSTKYRGEVKPHAEHGFTPLNTPLAILAVPSVVAGYLGVSLPSWMSLISGTGKAAESPFGTFVHYVSPLGSGAPEPINAIPLMLSVTCAGVGIWLAWSVYAAGQMTFNSAIAKAQPGLYNFSLNKWYFDEAYQSMVNLTLSIFSGVWYLFDKFVIDNIVDFASTLAKMIGGWLRYTESGKGQIYALVIIASAAAISFIAFMRF